MQELTEILVVIHNEDAVVAQFGEAILIFS